MKKNVFQWMVVALALLGLTQVSQAQDKLLNASYDVGREVYASINKSFIPYWKAKTGKDVTIDQSHAGSSAQARSVLEGLEADVVTFNQVTDVQRLVKGGLVAQDWQKRLPHNASPFYSVHGILVRKGNPKGITNWDDLAKPGVKIVQVNPKTGGNGRYAVLAYYGYALKKNNGDEAKARAFLKSILANVEVFERGGRAATTAFTERGIGDVLVTFESETLQLAASGEYEVVTPSASVLSEFPVAVVETYARKHKTLELAKGYLEYLYTPEAQDIIAKTYYRPRNEEVAKKHSSTFKAVDAFEVSDTFGGDDAAQKKFFDNNALVDQILAEIAQQRNR
jgi:sulfate transport system substrate-binding protein